MLKKSCCIIPKKMQPYLFKSALVLLAFLIIVIAALVEFWFFPVEEFKCFA